MPGIVPIADLFAPIDQQTMLATFIAIYQQLQLPVTAWQPGDEGLTLIQGMALRESANTNAQATIIQGGFLDYAANVTPDPSVTPGVAPGWLDVLASSVYNVSNTQGGIGRIQAKYAPVQMTFTNTGSSDGPYAPGTFHVANPTTAQTYSNTTTFTLGTGTTTTPFAADVAGKTGGSGPGLITQLITSVLGVTCTNLTAAVGSNAESNVALVARCRAKLGALSPDGPALAYDYVSKTIPLPSPLIPLSSGALTTPGNPVTRTKQITSKQTLTLTNYVASAAGPYVAPNAYTGSAALPVTGVTNANPAQVTVTAHGYATGDNIYLAGTGLALLDGNTFAIIVTGANTFTIGAASGGTSTTGTAYRQSDLDLIDKTVQTYCVPLTVTCVNASAPANTITISGTLYLKRGSTLTSAAAISAATTALSNYFATLPLGGDDLGGSSYFFLLEPMQNAVEQAMPNDCLQFIITSPTASVPVNTPQDVAVLAASPTITVIAEI